MNLDTREAMAKASYPGLRRGQPVYYGGAQISIEVFRMPRGTLFALEVTPTSAELLRLSEAELRQMATL